MKIFTYVARRGNLTRPNFIRTLGKGLPPLPNHPPAKVGKLPSSFPKPLQFDSPDGKNKIPLILQEYFILVHLYTTTRTYFQTGGTNQGTFIKPITPKPSQKK